MTEDFRSEIARSCEREASALLKWQVAIVAVICAIAGFCTRRGTWGPYTIGAVAILLLIGCVFGYMRMRRLRTAANVRRVSDEPE